MQKDLISFLIGRIDSLSYSDWYSYRNLADETE